MIFVVEEYFNSRKAKIKAWEVARDDWVKSDTHGFRSRGQYHREHPFPVIQWEKGLPIAFGMFAALAVVSCLIFVTVHHHQATKPTKQPSVSSRQVTFKVGDTVQVVYGEFKNSVGKIVKIDNNSAIITLTNSTYTKAIASAQDYTDGLDNGSLLVVSSLDNLVPHNE